jgi:hypothetical protein
MRERGQREIEKDSRNKEIFIEIEEERRKGERTSAREEKRARYRERKRGRE